MRDSRPQLNSELIYSLSDNIRTKANLLFSLNQEVHRILPQSKNICRVANYRNGILVLECASAAWVTRLNYDRQYLLSSLRQTQLSALTTIEIKVNPELAAATREQHKPIAATGASLSTQAAAGLINLASFTPEKIATRLRKIAKLAK